MCGRYMMTSPVEALRHMFRLESGLNLAARYNMAPMQPIPIIRLGGEDEWKGRGLILAQWGLVPSWMKELPTGKPMINARAETVAVKPSFRGALQHHRCLIPANGFYEWQAPEGGGAKQPHLIHLKGEGEALPLFAFAGLSEMWTGQEFARGGENALESAAILTTSANAVIAPLHHRMPVILRPQDYALWLGEEDVSHKEVLQLLSPFDDADFAFHPVSRRVNFVANDDPALVEESTEDEAGQKKLI
jgi:putative SOS response-associated peptidase YedK